MKFVSVRELRLNPAKVWKLARQEKELVVTANGRPVAILTGTDVSVGDKSLQNAEIQRPP